MEMSDIRETKWYQEFLMHPEFIRKPQKHPEVAEFIKDPKNIAIYLKDAKTPHIDYLKYMPSIVFDVTFRETLVEFLSHKGHEFEFLPNSLKKDETLIRIALDSDPQVISFLDEGFRDNAEFVLPYLIRDPFIITYLSERLQNDKELIRGVIKASVFDVLGLLPEQLQSNPELIQSARIAIFRFGSEDAWDSVDWAKLNILDDDTWTFTAARGTRQYEGLGYSQIHLDEFMVTGTWKKIDDNWIRLTPTVPLSLSLRMGESKSTEVFPRGTIEVGPIDLSYLDIQNGKVLMKRYFHSGDVTGFQIVYGIPKFLG
jgi:hypothetical protein